MLRYRIAEASGRLVLVAMICALACTSTAQAMCTQQDIQHDRSKGPYVTYFAYGARPTREQRRAFDALSARLRKRIRHYADYQTAFRHDYAPFATPADVRRLPPGTLVELSLNGLPRTVDTSRLTLLYYRRTASGLHLVGGGFAVWPDSYYNGTAPISKLNAMLPMALAHWHTVQNACSAPFIPGYEATFRLRGSTLDWTWPGVDKYDLAGAGTPTH